MIRSLRAIADSRIPIQACRQKLILYGDLLELGSGSRQLHEEIGSYARGSVDLLITYGQQAEYYGGKHFTEETELLRYLKGSIAGDEVVLFKASRALHFERFVERFSRLLR